MCSGFDMIARIAVLSLLLTGSIPAQVLLQFPSNLVWPGVTYSSVVPLASSGRLLVGTRSTTSAFGVARHAIEIDAIGTAAYTGGAVLGGNGDDTPAAAAVDPKGNIWIVGSTTSDDFNLVNPIVSQKVPYQTSGFVIETDPTGAKLLFATYLGGDQAGSSFLRSYASQIVFDASGNAYVAGATDEAGFPVTPGAFQTKGGGADWLNSTPYYAFLTKISPAGKLLYGTLLGAGNADCSSGSSCIAWGTFAYVNGMAVDSNGSVTLSGITNVTDFPTTAGTPQQSCNCRYPYGSGFVTRLSPDASKVLWSTYVSFLGATTYLGMAQDSQGNVHLFGEYGPYSGYQYSNALVDVFGLFVAELSADGSQLTGATDLGQSRDVAAHGIALDWAGNEYVTGTSSSAQFPTFLGVPNFGADFVLKLNASPSQAQSLVRLPTGTIGGPPAFDGGGNLLLVSNQNAVLQLPPQSVTTTPGVIGFANAASFAGNLGLYPGALVSLFGFDLAPAAQSAAPGASGNFPTTLGGVQVLMNGTPAPLLYVGPNQINLQVPFEIGRSSTLSPQISVQVILPSGTLAMQFAESQSLGVFTDGGGLYAAALNQDGTVNSAANPAAPGSMVTLFGTGADWLSTLADGEPASAATPLSQELFQIRALVRALVGDDVGTDILYAGAAPGMIDGVFQLNVQLPFWVKNPVSLTLGSATAFAANIVSNRVLIYIR
jgi:uncharacterized protein (TIGR03437 family)